MRSLPRVALPDFTIDADELEGSIETPITEGVRFDMKFAPDVSKPSYIRRVVAFGMDKWAKEGDGTTMTALVVRLLYLYFTGQLSLSGQTHREEARFSFVDEEENDDEFEFNPAFTEA